VKIGGDGQGRGGVRIGGDGQGGVRIGGNNQGQGGVRIGGDGQGGIRIDGRAPSGGNVRIDGDNRGSFNPGPRFDGDRGDRDGRPDNTRNFDPRRFDGRNFDGRSDGDRRSAGFRGDFDAGDRTRLSRNFNYPWYSGSWANRNFGPRANNFGFGTNAYGLGYGGLGYGGFGNNAYRYGGNNGLTTLLRIGAALSGGGFGSGFGGYGLGNYGGYGLYGGYPLGWGYGSGLGNFAYSSGYLPYMNPYYASGMGGWNYAQPIPTMLVTEARPGAQQMFDQAVAQFRAGEYQAALATVDQAIQQNPSDHVMHEFRALTLFAMGDFKNAAATIHPVLAVGPGWDWATLSNLYDNIDVYTAQLRRLESAVTSNPNQADNQFLLAYHYTTAGHSEAAAKRLAEVVRISPNDRLAADLLKMNQLAQQSQSQPAAGTTAAAQAPPEAPAPPQPPQPPVAAVTPVDPQALVGTWHAERPDGTKFDLQLTDDNKFTWKVNQKGQEQSMEGTFGVEKDLLALESPQAGGMVGRVEVKEPNLMTFKMLGAPQDDQGLTFRR
jgi:tetratricopeptide (TPR) repeat protein